MARAIPGFGLTSASRMVALRASAASLPAKAKTHRCGNQIVAPGFIDVHTHVESIYSLPAAENFVRMGVTTLVTGNCGSSTTDVGEFLGRIKEKPLAVNLATLIAHGSVRRQAMGSDDRAQHQTRQKKMEALVEQGMKDGAVGLINRTDLCPGHLRED